MLRCFASDSERVGARVDLVVSRCRMEEDHSYSILACCWGEY